MDLTKANIPVIDISPSNPDAPEQLLSAASKYGFVFIKNSPETGGIPPQDIAKMFELSKEFFAAPLEVKEQVSIASNKAGKNHGWLSQGIEKLDPKTQKRADVKEYVRSQSSLPISPSIDILCREQRTDYFRPRRAFNMGEPLTDNTIEQPLPTPLAPHQQTIVDFQNSCHALCQRIFTHLAMALATPADWFTSRHDRSRGPSGTVFRMLYYPALTPQDGDDHEDRSTDLRAGAHSDFGSLTLLFQLPGQPGLEIKTPEGEWASVPVDPSGGSDNDDAASLPILLNIGDLLEDVSPPLSQSPHVWPNETKLAREHEGKQTKELTNPNKVDIQPPQINSPPRDFPTRRQVRRPLLASLLLSPARRRPAGTRA